MDQKILVVPGVKEPLAASQLRAIGVATGLWAAGEYQRLKYLAEFRRSQFLDLEPFRALQLNRLQEIVSYAYAHCSYYRDRWQRAGLTPEHVRSLNDLEQFPILEKSEIQKFHREMVAENWPQEDLIRNQTGGSTGQPVPFFVHKDRLESRVAATLRHNSWAGLKLGHRVAYVWGAPQDVPPLSWKTRIRHHLMGKELWLDTAHITEQRMEEYTERLRSFRPRSIVAYANGIVLLARYLRSLNIRPFQPHSIITSAETLRPEDRDLVEQVFGCPVFNRYGCREVAVIASECEHHDGLHVMAEGLLVEVVRDGRAAKPGELGEILVTDLLNRAMPLIRYRIGDMGAWAEGCCPCGRGLPRLREISGRVTDFLVGSDGRLVSGVFLATYVVAQRPSLGKVQIRQDQKGHLQFLVCPSPNYDPSADEEYLKQATRKYLGLDTTAEVCLVDELITEESGKLLFSKSSVTPEFVGADASLDGLSPPFMA